RNVRLTDNGKKQALALSAALRSVSEKVRGGAEFYSKLKQEAISFLENADGVELEYFEICDLETLQPVDRPQNDIKLVALVAAWVEGVRLIDNMFIDQPD